MPDTDPNEIEDDELLYRRIPDSMGWYSGGSLSPQAFDPRKDDDTGISISRAELISLEDAARGRSQKGYWVAVLRAGDLREQGIEVTARPIPENSAHAEIPDLNTATRSTDRGIEMMKILADLTIRVEGKFLHST